MIKLNINNNSLLYPKENTSEWLDQKSSLYEKNSICPVCGSNVKVKAVKTSHYRVDTKDTDFFIRYQNINPYFYDVWICNDCGYSAMKVDFNKIRSFQIENIKEQITPSWTPKTYPDVYNIDQAIERYKLALLNYVILESKNSKKAMCSLKLAWMYRLKEDSKNEDLFLKQSLDSFLEAFSSEDFPIYGMDRYATMYLISELLIRTNKSEEALPWISQVLTSPGVSNKLKNLARDQKELIQTKNIKPTEQTGESTVIKPSKQKKGFLSRFFKL